VAKSKKPKWKKKVGFFVLVRNYTAIFSTWAMNLNLFGLSFKKVCTPGFNCHGCPWATSACPVGVATFGSAIHVLPAVAIASILTVGVLLGRMVCAFVCPFGLFQELMHRIPSPKFKLPRFARHLKYAALILLVIALPQWLGFEHEGYLRIDKAEFVDVDEEEADEAEADAGKADGKKKDGQKEDTEEDDESYEKWLESGDDEEEWKVKVTVTVTNLGDKPVIDPRIDIVQYQKPKKKGGALGSEVGRIERAFAGTVIPPGQTKTLPAFTIKDTRDDHVLFTDSPQGRVEQKPRYDLYYCKVCPIGGLEATIPRLAADKGRGWGEKLKGDALKLGITALFLGLMVFFSRPFCRMFCPLGATYALLSKLAISGMAFDKSKCGGCGLCIKVCPVEIDPTREVGGRDCILCGDCIKVCPKGSLYRTFGFHYSKPEYRDFDLKQKRPKAASETGVPVPTSASEG